MGMKNGLLAAAGLLAVSTAASSPAAAADLALPDAATARSWTGFYLGAHAGYAWARDPMVTPFFAGTFPNNPALTEINSRGWLAGFQAGANWQSGAWLGGLEIDLSGSNISGATSAAGTTNTLGAGSFQASGTRVDKFDGIGSARVRIGYLPWPNVLLYGTGGAAWVRIDQTETILEAAASPGSSVTIASSSTTPSWRFGWVAGIGAETRLWDSNWLGRLEYLHYDLGDSGNSSIVGLATTTGLMTVDLVRAGLSYQFGLGPSLLPSPQPRPIYTKAPASLAQPWSWTGFCVGGHGGYGWGHGSYGWAEDSFTELELVRSAGVVDINSNGFLGGFQAGANWQKGALVGGLETDLSATGIHGSSFGVSGTGSALTTSDAFRLLGSARARFGYLVWPTTLLYGTAGLAWTHLDQTVVDAGLGSNTTPLWRFGWVAGLGAEQRIADTDWVGRIEYLHYDFGDSGSFLSTTGAIINESFGSDRKTVDVLRAGASYKFGGYGGGAPAPAILYKAAPAIAESWSGFYLGAHGGFGWGHDPVSETVLVSPPPFLKLSGLDSSGWLGGFHAGANWQTSRWLVGAEFDLSATGIKGSTSGSTTSGTTTLAATQTDKFDFLGSGRARLGYLPCPNVLLYGTGGLAWTRFAQSITATQSSPASFALETQTTPFWRWGWVAGLGAETRIAQSNWLARLEYLHYDFGDSTNSSLVITNVFNGSTTTQSAIEQRGRVTDDVLRAGVSYQLN
jgi:opacity protein-like surface antigen